MKKITATCLFAAVALAAGAKTPEWLDPEVNAVNRAPMHSSYFAFESVEDSNGDKASSDNYVSLNGKWKFNWVADADKRPTDFWKVNYDDSSWGQINVPGMWELNGYGDPIYVNNGYAWRNHFENNPPQVPEKDNHVGTYRKEIEIPADWKGKDVIAHFGSATSNISLWVNGKYVGYGEDSKLENEFDITPYIRPGQKNLITFQIFRWCDGTYLEDQDFFRFSGLARDSYLYARSKNRIQDIRVNADLTDDYAAVPAEMKAVAAHFGKAVLRDVPENEFYAAIPALRTACGDRAVLRAIHFFDENRRVDSQRRALAENDLEAYFEGVRASGLSSFRYLQNVYTNKNVAEQGLSLALCLTEHFFDREGVRGVCRVHGGGFAGTIQAYVPADRAADYAAAMNAVFGADSCYVLRIRRSGAVKVF